MITAQQLVKQYGLQPHPEGGWYKETYRSNEYIPANALPSKFGGDRAFSTAIYFLLEHNDFSAFHRIKSDEMWHFYEGTALNIYVIDPAGNFELITLGKNFTYGETFQAVVKAGNWFAAQPADPEGFCFVGCTVAPGFDFKDMELAGRESMIFEFPQHSAIIQKLTRQ